MFELQYKYGGVWKADDTSVTLNKHDEMVYGNISSKKIILLMNFLRT
jgi:hypothetical protein